MRFLGVLFRALSIGRAASGGAGGLVRYAVRLAAHEGLSRVLRRLLR